MDKKWVYFIQLSNHMWDDGNGRKRFWYNEYSDTKYTPENNVDFSVWTKSLKGQPSADTIHS